MPLKVDILLFEDCLASEAFAVRDTLMLAAQMPGAPAYAVQLVAAGGRSVALAGLEVTAGSPRRWPDVLVVPGLAGRSGAGIIARCTVALGAERQLISDARDAGVRIAAVCVGAFLVAAAGGLDGRRATTAWALTATLQRWRPDLQVEEGPMVLTDGPVTTTGAMTAAYDLALALVTEVEGADAARRLRKFLALDGDRDDQRRYGRSLPEGPRGDALVERAQRVIVETLAEGLDVPALAGRCGASPRTLLRRFRAVTGETPLMFRQRLVVDAACSLLETTTLPLAEIPARVGYADDVSLRRLFRARTGLTLAAYRRRFGALPAHRSGSG